MSYALLGSLIFRSTFVPVLASYWFKNGVKEVVNRPYEWLKRIRRGTGWCLDHPMTMMLATVIFGASLLLVPLHRRRIHAPPGRRRTLGARHHAVHHLVRGGCQVRARKSQNPHGLPAGDRGRFGAGPPGRWHRPDRILQLRVLRRAEAVQRQDLGPGRDPQQGGTDRGSSKESLGVSRRDLQLHTAGRGRRGRGAHRAQERARGQNLRRRSAGARGQGGRDQARAPAGAGLHRTDRGARTRPAHASRSTWTAKRSLATASTSPTSRA